ncbi:hypothetical protein AB0M50_06235 [Nonomuraea fuscirosea]|uniref:hypothetical protein n=1 Tax=Nonomuraea fuscirosea TaxID=1291556 RepID=UPI002DD9C3FB|nr:hypothetical protein [Nonomuraea fuscirosea]WSA53791.1 hypothetical protein OIE67_03895 [Nonomuraea fuscirosea]
MRPLPDNASFEVGASLGVPALTAHRALTVAENGPRRLAPKALDSTIVLVTGGAGAVGHAAIQLVLFTDLDRMAAAADDVTEAVRDGAMGVGTEHGLPIVRFPLAETAAAHTAVQNHVVGKVVVDPAA